MEIRLRFSKWGCTRNASQLEFSKDESLKGLVIPFYLEQYLSLDKKETEHCRIYKFDYLTKHTLH